MLQQKPGLLVERTLNVGRGFLVVPKEMLRRDQLHAARRLLGLVFCLPANLRNAATSSSAVSNGPVVRPFLKSFRLFAMSLLTTFRWAGVYSSSAFGNFDRSTIN